MRDWGEYYRIADELYFGTEHGVKLRHPVPDFERQRLKFYEQNATLSGGTLLAAANSLRELPKKLEQIALYPLGDEWVCFDHFR